MPFASLDVQDGYHLSSFFFRPFRLNHFHFVLTLAWFLITSGYEILIVCVDSWAFVDFAVIRVILTQ